MTLYPFQRTGVAFLAARRRAYLADEMGLGKTAQACVALTQVREPGDEVLVVCPASMVDNWRAEWGVWGSGRMPRIISYEGLGRLPVQQWKAVVFDEAHYLKNPRALRTRRAALIVPHAWHTWMLSATPMPNHPMELYAPMRMLRPAPAFTLARLQTKWAWLNRFCEFKQSQYGIIVTGAKNHAMLREFIAPVFLRRRQQEVLAELPPLRIDQVRLQFSSSYADVERDIDPSVLRRLLSDHPPPLTDPYVARLRRRLGEYKCNHICALLEAELLNDHYAKVVVLAHHRRVLDEAEDLLSPFGVLRVDGDTPMRERQRMVTRFQTDESQRVFLAQNSVGGVGFTLTAAREIVLLEPPWSPGEMVQAIKRIHRIGQDAPCRARVFSVARTLDDAITGVLTRKARMITDVVEGLPSPVEDT